VDPDARRAGISSVGLIAGGDDDEVEIAPRERPGLEKAPPLPTGEAHLKGILESLLFVTDKPLPPNRLAKIARASTKEVQRLLDVLTEQYRGRGIELVEVAGGYQFRSSAENAPFVRELVARKPVRLTRAQIETLSILAYRQPITRPEVDEVRGVDSGSALKVLLEKGLVRIIGRKEEPGRPLLYGTTAHFLEFFGLPSLAELPTLREYSELSDESRALFQRRTGEAIDQIGELGGGSAPLQ
jgi:segregation and condensation protein B